MMKKGKFIVIEGIDGSGKTRQFKMLTARLRKEGLKFETIDFPQYEKPSSYFVCEYLNGNYGTSEEVGPYKASIFYALDRFSAGKQISEWLKRGKIVISNRYVASNMGHQGAKIKSKNGKRKLFKWLDELEYGILKIPKPDLNIFLHMPAPIAQKLVDKKGAREYAKGVKRDIHEADLRHLRQAEQTYLYMVETFPKYFKIVECVKNGRILSWNEIHKVVWDMTKKVLSKNGK